MNIKKINRKLSSDFLLSIISLICIAFIQYITALEVQGLSQPADYSVSSEYNAVGLEDIPNITVTGTIYHPDGETPMSGVGLSYVAGENDNLFSPRIFLSGRHTEEGVFSTNGDFKYYIYKYLIEAWSATNRDGYIELPSTYDPTDHLYLSINSDTTYLWGWENYVYARPDRIDLGVITEDSIIDVGDIIFKNPNVTGTIATAPGVPTDHARIVLTAIGETPTWDDQMIPISNSGYDGEFWFYKEPGNYVLRIYTGGDSVTGYINRTTLDELQREIAVTITENGIDLGEVYTTSAYSSRESFLESNSDSVVNPSPSIDNLLTGVDRTALSKDTVGLNVHLALQGVSFDNPYIDKLTDSGTKWVREHFSTEVDIPGSAGWKARYQYVKDIYRSRDINIVGMLAYGFTHGDTSQPNLTQWSNYVTDVVTEYKDYVKVWEVWNEPDLDQYLNPNTMANYIPMLKVAYEAIKAVDSSALVLSAPASWPNATWYEQLYQQGSNYFDEPSMHAYYCDQYKSSGNLGSLQRDFGGVLAVINKYRPSDRIWITEFGCSTYGEYSENFQLQYLKAAIPYLLSTDKVEKVFIYNILNRELDDPYEDNFGLLHTNFVPKPAWNWYKTFTSGSLSYTAPVASGISFFAYNSNIRGGFHVTAGNVMGDGADEIISGTHQGIGPHVRIFDANSNLLSQFYAYDQNLRNGVTVSACDIDGDGTDEIVTAQGPGGWPLVRIFNAYGHKINEFNVLDGKFVGGVNLSCGDTDGDGTSEIVVAAMHGGGPHVLVYNSEGRILTNFMAYDQNFRGGINVTTIDMDGDGRDEIVTGPQYGAPHIQIFQIRPNELKRLSPGFYAFSSEYRGGVSVSGVDTDGDGQKELLVGVGDDAQPLVKKYNIQEELQGQMYAFGTNFLGGVNLTGGDVDNDGADEIIVIPRGNGGPNVRIIEGSEIQ